MVTDQLRLTLLRSPLFVGSGSGFTRTGLGINPYGLGTRTFGKNLHELSTAFRETEPLYSAIGVSLNGDNAEAACHHLTNCRLIDLPDGADGRQTSDWSVTERR